MAVQELGMMDYFRQGGEIGQALASAMAKRRQDAIAAELGAQFGMPAARGMDELRIRMELEKTMQAREREKFANQKLQGEIAAQPIENREREARAKYYESYGEREDSKAANSAYKENLDSYNREREKLSKELTDLEAGLTNEMSEKSGGKLTLENWKAQKNAWRGDETGNSQHGLISRYMGGASPGENGTHAHIKLGDDTTVSLPWEDYQDLLGKVRTLETRRSQLDSMKVPEKPSPASTPAAPAKGTGTPLSPELAAHFMAATGGDKEKARQMARDAGFTF